MDKGKYYVYKQTGNIYLVMKSEGNDIYINVLLWNCCAKIKERWKYLSLAWANEWLLEINRDQAYNPDFQKWMRLTYGQG